MISAEPLSVAERASRRMPLLTVLLVANTCRSRARGLLEAPLEPDDEPQAATASTAARAIAAPTIRRTRRAALGSMQLPPQVSPAPWRERSIAPVRRRLLVLPVIAALAVVPARAAAAPVIVLGPHGRVTHRNDRFITGSAAAQLPGPRGRCPDPGRRDGRNGTRRHRDHWDRRNDDHAGPADDNDHHHHHDDRHHAEAVEAAQEAGAHRPQRAHRDGRRGPDHRGPAPDRDGRLQRRP